MKLSESVSSRMDRESEQLCSKQEKEERDGMCSRWFNCGVSWEEQRERSLAVHAAASDGPASTGQGLVTRDDIKQFFVYRLLANAVQLEIQVFQDSVNVLLRSLHRRQAAGIFAGKRLSARLKQQNKQIFAYESAQRRLGSLNDFRRSNT